MSGFDVQLAEMLSARDTVAQIQNELRTGEGKLAESVSALLGGGWHGAAASAFASGWDEWRTGAAQVLDGLQRTSVLLGQAEQLYDSGDQLSAGIIDRLNGRL